MTTQRTNPETTTPASTPTPTSTPTPIVCVICQSPFTYPVAPGKPGRRPVTCSPECLDARTKETKAAANCRRTEGVGSIKRRKAKATAKVKPWSAAKACGPAKPTSPSSPTVIGPPTPPCGQTATTTPTTTPTTTRPGASGGGPRNPHPTAATEPYADDELEFIKAIDRYRRKHKRPFPAASEVLAVLKSLGYRKVEPTN